MDDYEHVSDDEDGPSTGTSTSEMPQSLQKMYKTVTKKMQPLRRKAKDLASKGGDAIGEVAGEVGEVGYESFVSKPWTTNAQFWQYTCYFIAYAIMTGVMGGKFIGLTYPMMNFYAPQVTLNANLSVNSTTYLVIVNDVVNMPWVFMGGLITATSVYLVGMCVSGWYTFMDLSDSPREFQGSTDHVLTMVSYATIPATGVVLIWLMGVRGYGSAFCISLTAVGWISSSHDNGLFVDFMQIMTSSAAKLKLTTQLKTLQMAWIPAFSARGHTVMKMINVTAIPIIYYVANLVQMGMAFNSYLNAVPAGVNNGPLVAATSMYFVFTCMSALLYILGPWWVLFKTVTHNLGCWHDEASGMCSDCFGYGERAMDADTFTLTKVYQYILHLVLVATNGTIAFMIVEHYNGMTV
jgi:hypothetical protein